MNIQYYLAIFFKYLRFPAIKNTEIHRTSRVWSGSILINSEIGKYTYVGNDCKIIQTEIGNFCSIADNCIIGGESHPIQFVSTSPVFIDGINILFKNFSKHNFNTTKKTYIGHDVWIGNNCLIKSGISIGNGSIIGMGSVLTKSVGDYEIWAGNPAKLIRLRFPDKTINELKLLKWWNWSETEISNNSYLFNNVDTFLGANKKK